MDNQPPATILMPCNPGQPGVVDMAYAGEASAARTLGLHVALVDHDILQRSGSAVAALQRCRLPPTPGMWAYRGWMMPSDAYADLVDVLAARGYPPLVDAPAYQALHHGPNTAGLLAPWSALSTGLPIHAVQDGVVDRSQLSAALAPFGRGGAVVKDWVKSQAGLWLEACFIPDASDTAHAARVVERFVQLQGPDLVGGLVFKQYHQLLMGQDGHALEWRAFVVDGKPVLVFERSGNAAGLPPPPMDLLARVAALLPSRLASMDWAQQVDGQPLLLEAGDGGVSGLPGHVDPRSLLDAIGGALLPKHTPTHMEGMTP